MMNRITLLLCLGAILVGVAACQSTDIESARRPLRLEYTQWWGDYTAIIAQEKGFFNKHGVQVELLPYEVFSRALPDLAAGKIDIGLLGIGDALNLARRVPLKVVAVYDRGGESTIVAAPGIAAIADLKGKTIGVPTGSSYELFVREMLESAGLSLEDVKLVSSDPEMTAERMPEEIQAAYVWDPYLTQLLDQGNHVLYTSEQGTRLFPDVITLRADTAAERPEDIKAFLRAWFEALEYRRANPDESNAIIARVTGRSLEEITAGQENILLQDLAENRASFAQDPGENTDSIHYTARKNWDYLINLGIASQAIDLSQILDPSYLP